MAEAYRSRPVETRGYSVWPSMPWRGIHHPVVEVYDEASFVDAAVEALRAVLAGKAREVGVYRVLVGGVLDGFTVRRAGEDSVEVEFSAASRREASGVEPAGPVEVGDVTVEAEFNDATMTVYTVARATRRYSLSEHGSVERLAERIVEDLGELTQIADDYFDQAVQPASQD